MLKKSSFSLCNPMGSLKKCQPFWPSRLVSSSLHLSTTCRLKYNENRAELLHLPRSIWDLAVPFWPEFFQNLVCRKAWILGDKKRGVSKALTNYGVHTSAEFVYLINVVYKILTRGKLSPTYLTEDWSNSMKRRV